MRQPLGFLALALLIGVGGASSCGIVPDAAAEPAPVEPVVREILAELDNPPGAPGQRLSLVRYTIAPAAKLAPHVHPGVQMASIVSGTLTYHVVSGTATVHRRVSRDGVPRRTETFAGPAETRLESGDAVVENGAMLHFGANMTADPVVILATLITKPGQGLAVPVSSSRP